MTLGVGRWRVLIVDDCVSVCRSLGRVIGREDDLQVVDTAHDGEQALRLAARSALHGEPIHVVLLDVEMPSLDGLATLPRLLAIEPRPAVVMLSALTKRGALTSLRALAAGADDYLAKPSTLEGSTGEAFRVELLERIRLWAQRQNGSQPARTTSHAFSSRVQPFVERSRPQLSGSRASETVRLASSMSEVRPSAAKLSGSKIPAASIGALRERLAGRVAVLAIGGSTGGPQALLTLFAGLRSISPRPIFVTQHMPPSFTTILAEQLSASIGRRCEEVLTDQTIRHDGVYLAAGDHHLVVNAHADGVRACASTSLPENFCRPSVDPMLRSISATFGRHVVAVILTGMGQDGTEGCRIVRQFGGAVLAQDEATSVVWGMPGSIVKNGLADLVLPLNDIGPTLQQIVQGLPT